MLNKANIISGAFAQSGGTAINFLYGANDENVVRSVCDGVNSNASRGTVHFLGFRPDAS